jgi:hypothetical protein
MPAIIASAAWDRSDFRTVTVGGAVVGLITAAAVVAFVLVSRNVGASVPQRVVESLIVAAAGIAVSFLPAWWTAARHTEGIAAAAATGLAGTVVFMAVDILLLRPWKAYPWTWDAIGGGSTWWYLPTWWMLGTFLAWMGGIITAGRAARGEERLAPLVLTVIGGTALLAVVAQIAGLRLGLPVETGAAFTITMAVLAAVTLARKQ